MKRRDYFLMIVLTLIAGLLGGALFNWIMVDKTAYAQGAFPHEKMLEAEELRLVDKDGNVLAALAASSDTGEPFLIIYDKNKKYRTMLGLVDGTARLVLRDSDANTRLALGGTELISTRKGAEEHRAESSLVMFNKEGKVIWSAP